MKGGKYVVNTQFTFLDQINPTPKLDTKNASNELATRTRVSKRQKTNTPINALNGYQLDAEVYDIGHREMILGLSWLKEHNFSVDIPNSRLINTNGVIIPCKTRHIPSVSIIENDDEFVLEEGDVLMILDVAELYSDYAQLFSAEQAARLPKHTKWDHEIPLKDSYAKMPTGQNVYKTTWEEKESCCKYLEENIPNGKIHRSR